MIASDNCWYPRIIGQLNSKIEITDIFGEPLYSEVWFWHDIDLNFIDWNFLNLCFTIWLVDVLRVQNGEAATNLSQVRLLNKMQMICNTTMFIWNFVDFAILRFIIIQPTAKSASEVFLAYQSHVSVSLSATTCRRMLLLLLVLQSSTINSDFIVIHPIAKECLQSHATHLHGMMWRRTARP